MLPIVSRVTRTRISYTRDFKIDCMRAYLAGESPSAIFRQVGLDSSLVGPKRIERCIARWKATPELVGEARALLESKGAIALEDIGKSRPSPYDVSHVSMPKSTRSRVDLRDLVIYQQSLHIHELEQELSHFRSDEADA